jgi:hypothetical protein
VSHLNYLLSFHRVLPDRQRRQRPSPSYRLLRLAPAALIALAGCAERSHPAKSPAELADEVAVMRAVAVSEIQSGSPDASICVARGIEASASLDSLPTTDLREIDGHVDEATERARGAQVQSRTLGDADLIPHIGREGLGTSCSGRAFLSFYRVQFSGEVAIAFVSSRDTCGRGMAVFKLRRSEGRWVREDMRALSRSDDFACNEREPATRAAYFAVRGGVRNDQP